MNYETELDLRNRIIELQKIIREKERLIETLKKDRGEYQDRMHPG